MKQQVQASYEKNFRDRNKDISFRDTPCIWTDKALWKKGDC